METKAETMNEIRGMTGSNLDVGIKVPVTFHATVKNFPHHSSPTRIRPVNVASTMHHLSE